MHILGRADDHGPTVELGVHRAPDGSHGAPVAFDLNTPHAGLVVGKRGSGKSHTLAVIAEDIATTDGLTGIVADPMGGLATLSNLPNAAHVHPTIAVDALPPRAWCSILDLDPATPVGSLVWRVAQNTDSLDAMHDRIDAATADQPTKRAAHNHITTAQHWDIFNPDGLTPTELCTNDLTILDLSTTPRQPANAILRALTDTLYDTATTHDDIPLPWLLVDEAHTFFDGVARPGLDRLLTRGRHPGISLVLATQRPAALPPTAISQADFLITHRLTTTADLDALETARPTFLRDSLHDRHPTDTGDALIIDDATEVARAIQIRDRHTPDGGASPTASDRTTPRTRVDDPTTGD